MDVGGDWIWDRRLILVTVRIEMLPPSRRELVQVLLHWAERVRADPGALAAHVYEDLETGKFLFLESRWRTRPALGAHVCSQSFGSLLGAVEVLAESSEIAVSEVAGEQSMTLRRLRDTLLDECGSI